MDDLRRLVDGRGGGGSADLARELLRSAATDGPRGQLAKARTLRALGVASGVGIAATVASAARAAATGIKAKVPLVVAKWIAVSAVVGGTAAVTYEATRPSAPPVEVAPPAERIAAAPPRLAARAGHAPAIDSSAEPPAPSSSEEPPVLADPPAPPAPSPTTALLPVAAPPRAPAPPAYASAPAIATPTASEPSPLAAEVASLESARAALASGRPGDALGALDRYGRDFPRGHLSPEAAVLRIQALAAAGDRARSRALADAFLRDHPDSPYAPRLRPYASAP